MIQLAGKYTDVRKAAKAMRPKRHALQGNGQTSGPPAKRGMSRVGFIFVPRLGKEIPFCDWYFQELREGGVLKEYLRRERFLSPVRHRAVAQRMNGFQQNLKSEFKRLADVPAREYFRWKAVDPHFWEDDKNLRSYRRDNPDACVYL